MGKGGINPKMLASMMKNKDVMKLVKGLTPEQMEWAVQLANTIDIKKAMNPKNLNSEELEKIKSCASELGITGLENAEVEENN